MPERSDTVTSVSVSEKRRGDTERAHQRAEGGQRGDTDPRRMTDRSSARAQCTPIVIAITCLVLSRPRLNADARCCDSVCVCTV